MKQHLKANYCQTHGQKNVCWHVSLPTNIFLSMLLDLRMQVFARAERMQLHQYHCSTVQYNAIGQ